MADAELRALAERLQGLCLGRGLTVGLAESCTGGAIAATLTDIAGSSGYFRGSVVAYSNSAKVTLLGVPEATLAAHGAVSAQVARAMATTARDRFGVTLAVSVTGISGPDGATDQKPVGLTYLALAAVGSVDVQRHLWAGDREQNRRETVRAVLRWLVDRAETTPQGGPE